MAIVGAPAASQSGLGGQLNLDLVQVWLVQKYNMSLQQNQEYIREERKIDGVGPVDNRPSTD